MLKGLRKKESYDEILNELDKDPIKHYPNREATRLENSPYLSQLSAGFEEMEEQHISLLKQQMKDNLIREYASTKGINLTHARLKADNASDYHSAHSGDEGNPLIRKTHIQHTDTDTSYYHFPGTSRTQHFKL
jgi:hypothetical protein